MMDRRGEKLCAALNDIDAAYIEETLDFKPKQHRLTSHVPRLSGICAAVLIILGLTATAFAISRIPLSWRDIFSPSQTVIGNADEAPVVSQQQPQAAATEELQIKVEKVISDERTLYLLYSVKANDGAVLDQSGKFADFELYFPSKMMSGAYVSRFLERKDGVPENELEGVVYADWQPGDSANDLVMSLSDWQEQKAFEDVTVDFNVAEMVENADENANLPQYLDSFANGTSRYRWQPGDAEVKLPYGGASICNAGWENGVLQLVMKGPAEENEWTAPENWYFIDTRTGAVIYPDSDVHFSYPSTFDSDAADADWRYIWEFLTVDKEALPYLEMHWGGKAIFTTVLSGKWKVSLNETPITVQSEVLAENIPLSYGGETLLTEKIACSKLSMAVYFADYVDSTTGILGAFQVFDANGDIIPCDWGFTAHQTGSGCMIWTRFKEPIEPESICRVTFDGATIFLR